MTTYVPITYIPRSQWTRTGQPWDGSHGTVQWVTGISSGHQNAPRPTQGDKKVSHVLCYRARVLTSWQHS